MEKESVKVNYLNRNDLTLWGRMWEETSPEVFDINDKDEIWDFLDIDGHKVYLVPNHYELLLVTKDGKYYFSMY